MNDQPVFPSNSSGPFASGSPNLGGSSGGGSGGGLKLVLIGVLALGAVVFAVLAIVFYDQSSSATKTLNQQKSAAASAARTEQKKADDIAYTQANESPYRSFAAPDEFGAFMINFPKNWSSYVDEESSGTQVLLILNPNSVGKTNGTDNLAAARITLLQDNSDDFMGNFSGEIKSGQLHQNPIKVSGQAGYDLTGKFDNNRTVREVVIPVRDKVLVFINENSAYAGEFKQILDQAKINP
jgi:hypothetical protein